MKKLLSLLFVFTLVACWGSDDDDDNSTDPFIGTWELIYTGEDASSYDTTMLVRSDGTYTTTDIFYGTENSIYIDTGTWTNMGSDLNSLSQTYYITVDEESQANSLITVIFSSDFNSLNINTYRGDWERQ